MSPATDSLWTTLREKSPYDVMALRPDFGPARDLPPDVLNVFVQTACVLGDVERVLIDGLDNPVAAHLPEDGAAMLLYTLYASGNGALLSEGRVAMEADSARRNVLGYIACCLMQGGEARRAAELLAKLVQQNADSPHPGHVRLMLEAFFRASDVRDPKKVGALLNRAHIRMNAAWVGYETFRRAPGPDAARALPFPTEGAVRRAKHIGSMPPDGPGRILVPGEGADGAARMPADAFATDLGAHVSAAVAAVEGLRDEPEIANALEALADIRARHAPEAGDPVQVISTGRAGTTALFDFLDPTPYCSYHSYAWVTGPRHRWAMTTLLLEGEGTPDRMRPFVDLFLFCRLPELAAAYRRGKTPVLISHWDTIFAPVLAGLFPGSRFVHLRRDPEAVIGSMIAKRQYAGSQIAALPFLDSGSARLFDSAALYRELPWHVAWYLAFTERYWGALGQALGPRASAEIESDALFRGEAEGLDVLLQAAFPGSGRDPDAARAHFGRKINEKAKRKMDETDLVRDYQGQALAQYRAFARRTSPAAQ